MYIIFMISFLFFLSYAILTKYLLIFLQTIA